MSESAKELWWKRIHGPRLLRNQIEKCLLTPEKGLWIHGDLPWTADLQEMVSGKLGERDGQTCITCREAEELEGLEPADLIFALNPEARYRYMPSKPLAEYIRDNKLLETHLLWLSGLTEERHGAWLALSRDLARLKTGFRIVCQGQTGTKKQTNLTILRTDACFTEFDHILFALQLAAESGASLDLQMYCSYLAADLTGGRAEEIPPLMESPEDLAGDPERRTEELGLELDRERLVQILHSVQIKVLLPALEARQEELVDELSEDLRAIMPFRDEFGREFRELYEVELRNMFHLHNCGDLRLSPQQAQRLEQLYRLRNLVAHRKIVPGETVVEFLR